jgi:hypothetical protein
VIEDKELTRQHKEKTIAVSKRNAVKSGMIVASQSELLGLIKISLKRKSLLLPGFLSLGESERQVTKNQINQSKCQRCLILLLSCWAHSRH